jgi:hypothetical protein
MRMVLLAPCSLAQNIVYTAVATAVQHMSNMQATDRQHMSNMQDTDRSTQRLSNTCRQLSVGLQPDPGVNMHPFNAHQTHHLTGNPPPQRHMQDEATRVTHAGCDKKHSILCQHMQATVSWFAAGAW